MIATNSTLYNTGRYKEAKKQNFPKIEQQEKLAATVTCFELMQYYLWDHLKSVMFKSLPKILDNLKANVERKIEKIRKLKFFFIQLFLNFEKVEILIFRKKKVS